MVATVSFGNSVGKTVRKVLGLQILLQRVENKANKQWRQQEISIKAPLRQVKTTN